MTNQPIKVHFSNTNTKCIVSKDQSFEHDGEEGSILQIALGNNVEIDHACGGVGACSTCHVVIDEGAEFCQEATDDELDQLENAPSLQMDSRLACQCIPNGEGDIKVSIPAWNRNRIPSDH